MNGLLTVKRRQNGYRVYTDQDISRLKIIRFLRCANYSLEAIRNMLQQVSADPDIDIKEALDTPKEDADIITVSVTCPEGSGSVCLLSLHLCRIRKSYFWMN